ncbi:MAG TPA: HAMP domain-containing sensor histidine kinase [Bryobacteraceae bacterium]|nr:HAMP domain-containing sensor histidine kinase [Bryobacteraceae bacterium]
MGKPFGSRTLLLICAALMMLLAALAAVQYRWSTRVAAADAQREQERLDLSSSSFADRFNDAAGQAATFLNHDARDAVESGARVPAVPKLIAEVFYLEVTDEGTPQARHLASDGTFAPAALPSWIPRQCSPAVLDQPPAVVAPLYDLPRPEMISENGMRVGVRVFRTFTHLSERCFVARLDEGYLRSTLIPLLIRESFGETAAREYDFAVVSPRSPHDAIYGSPGRPDLRKPFFSVRPIELSFPKPPAPGAPGFGGGAIYVQRAESTIVTGGRAAPGNLFGPGAWELQVAHKGVPLAAAFEQTRRRDLLLSLAVEALLAAAILFLVVATQRAQRLADQKVQFVAGVSHELRSPVSAIAMLARNQADGLVAGTERVKQYGELIHQQSRRLNEMVEQALAYAGIHSGLRRAAKHEIDVRRLVEEAVDARREELARAGIEVEMAVASDLPPFSGDAALLRTAFDNLLDNAGKHAGGGRWIRVSAAYSAAGRQVRIGVEDRGAGIDPADQAEIFEPFCRGRAAVEAQIPGSGLGLSLVRSAAEAHRGTVTLVSQPGCGSTFTLHLPV